MRWSRAKDVHLGLGASISRFSVDGSWIGHGMFFVNLNTATTQASTEAA
jgi:hypothetical protein